MRKCVCKDEGESIFNRSCCFVKNEMDWCIFFHVCSVPQEACQVRNWLFELFTCCDKNSGSDMNHLRTFGFSKRVLQIAVKLGHVWFFVVSVSFYGNVLRKYKCTGIFGWRVWINVTQTDFHESPHDFPSPELVTNFLDGRYAAELSGDSAKCKALPCFFSEMRSTQK